MSRNSTFEWLLSRALLLAALAGCSPGDLQIRGATDRVVGEVVTLAMVQGGSVFNGELALRSADATLTGAELKATKLDPRTLSFTIPVGITTGPATAVIGRNAENGYEVPLHINRLALTLNESGILEAWPLTPGTLPLQRQELGASSGTLLSIAPSSSELAVAAADRIRLLALGPQLKDVGSSAAMTGVQALAALSGGRLLVATADLLVLFSFSASGPVVQASLDIKNVRAIAVAASAELAVVLYPCDKNACLRRVLLSPSLAEVPDSQIQLAASSDASLLAVTSDGQGAVVTDGTGIHGAYFGETPTQVSKVDWSSGGVIYTGVPVGLDSATGVVSAQQTALFAVAEQSRMMLYVLAFHPTSHTLQSWAPLLLPDTPTKLSFGRHTQLYVAFAKSVVSLDAGMVGPTIIPVSEIVPANNISALVVQR